MPAKPKPRTAEQKARYAAKRRAEYHALDPVAKAARLADARIAWHRMTPEQRAAKNAAKRAARARKREAEAAAEAARAKTNAEAARRYRDRYHADPDFRERDLARKAAARAALRDAGLCVTCRRPSRTYQCHGCRPPKRAEREAA